MQEVLVYVVVLELLNSYYSDWRRRWQSVCLGSHVLLDVAVLEKMRVWWACSKTMMHGVHELEYDVV